VAIHERHVHLAGCETLVGKHALEKRQGRCDAINLILPNRPPRPFEDVAPVIPAITSLAMSGS